ncbi:hypothetical protein HDV62DRAFT_219385 [Trichoderma sp. SZMC 28011]
MTGFLASLPLSCMHMLWSTYMLVQVLLHDNASMPVTTTLNTSTASPTVPACPATCSKKPSLDITKNTNHQPPPPPNENPLALRSPHASQLSVPFVPSLPQRTHGISTS